MQYFKDDSGFMVCQVKVDESAANSPVSSQEKDNAKQCCGSGSESGSGRIRNYL
jgi:hypothetical protein